MAISGASFCGVVHALYPDGLRVATAAVARPETPSVTGTFTDKPYTATTPDSGSCGNNWAIDLFTRQFVIHPQNTDGTWTVVEKFNNAKFITLGNGETGSASSPGACDTGNTGHLLREGVSGTFAGSFTITIAAGHAYTSGQGCTSNEGGREQPRTTAARPQRGFSTRSA